jgi:hypothetical protein
MKKINMQLTIDKLTMEIDALKKETKKEIKVEKDNNEKPQKL